jgi:regulator of protease activity HflC (stomatin/prohibitin superfamily)
VGGWASRHKADRTIDVDTLNVTRITGVAMRVGAVALGVLWIGLATLANSVHQVDAGHVGVVRTFGDITDQTGAGLVVTWPFQTLEEASVRVERYDIADLEAFSKETQDVFARITVNYQVSPRAIQTLYRDVGSKYIDTILRPRLINFFKETTVTYNTVDIAPNREAIRRAVKQRLTKDLEPCSIDIVDLLIENIDFRQEFKSAIEQKQVATQEALRQQQLIEANKAQAQQKIETARGDAESVRIAAEAQAAANKLLAESLTDKVIQFQALQKLADNVQIALLPSGQGIIIDPATLLKPLAE